MSPPDDISCYHLASVPQLEKALSAGIAAVFCDVGAAVRADAAQAIV